MNYIDGFVIAVPTTNREAFIEHARKFDQLLIEHGALRVVECWGDSVPDGKVTDFRRAVQASAEESVAFSWVEWPDKETRNRVHSRMEEMMKSGEIDSGMTDMPFDGKRMIFGGFVPVVNLGEQ